MLIERPISAILMVSKLYGPISKPISCHSTNPCRCGMVHSLALPIVGCSSFDCSIGLHSIVELLILLCPTVQLFSCALSTGSNDHRNKRRKTKKHKANNSVKEGKDAWPISYDIVPRRKRSDLGIVTVRLSPGFTIRKLPAMYKEFQRAQGMAHASMPQSTRQANRLCKDFSLVRPDELDILHNASNCLACLQRSNSILINW